MSNGVKLYLVSATSRNQLDASKGSDQAPPLQFGNGGGKSGGMEARVAKLESDVAHLVKQVDRIDARTESMPKDLAVLAEKVSALPTKDYLDEKFGKLLTRIGLVVALISAIVGIAFRFIPS